MMPDLHVVLEISKAYYNKIFFKNDDDQYLYQFDNDVL